MAKKEKISFDELLEHALVKDEDEPYEVPGNWVWTRVGVLGNVITGSTPSKNNISNYGELLPFFKPTDLNQGYFVVTANEYLSEEGKKQARIIPPSSTFVTCIGATIGKCGFSRVLGSCNQQINAITPHQQINGKFVYWLFNTPFMQECIISNSSSTTLPILNKSRFENLYVPLPPLPEQQRIVNLIESLFEKLDQAKELVQNGLDSIEERQSAILYKAFTGEVTAKWRKENDNYELSEHYLYRLKEKRLKANKKKSFDFWRNENLPFGWSETKIDNFIYIAGRIGWKGLKAEEYTESGPLFLSVYNLNYGDYVNFDKVYHISTERYEESPEIMLRDDDILLTKDGAGIGKLGYIERLPSKATVNSSLLLIRAGDSLESKYLFYFLKGPKMQEIVKSRITGSATPHLFQRDIKDFIIPIPPIEEQKEIVKILDKILADEEKAKELCDIIDNIDLMKKSILARAFRCELSTNNPNEESAYELLKEVIRERIK
jgi:type I restriction enzyme S subunit